jgi:hypothetical protein
MLLYQNTLILSIHFFNIFQKIAYNVPAVYDVLAARIEKCVALRRAKMWRRKTAQRPQADCGFS